MTEPTTECTSPTSYRYTLGPYDQPLFLIFTYPASDAVDSQHLTVRFLTAEQFEADETIVNDPKKTLYKLPAGQIVIVTISYTAPIGCLLQIEQITRPVGKYDSGPFPPPGVCAGFCPPYFKECPPDKVPECINGRLECR